MRDLYIASCTPDGGVYHYKMNKDGEVFFENKTDLDKPMFLAKENDTLYVLQKEIFEDGTSGLVSFTINEDGELGKMSDVASTKGLVACHLCVENGVVYAVNYSSGSVIKMPETLKTHEGKGPNEIRQEKAHTHYVGITPDNKYVCVTDLGLDTIFFYDRDLNLKFTVKVPLGHGARHLVFSSDGKIMYCANELESTVSVFRYDGENTKLLNTYKTLPDDFSGKNLAAAIRIHDGYLYISNRGYDGVTSFKINGEELELAGYTKVGEHPRDINIFDDVLVSTNMLDNTVTFYRLSEGKLTKYNTLEGIKEPLCVIG